MAAISVHRNDGKVLTFECGTVVHETNGTLVVYQRDSDSCLGEFAPGEWAYWIATNGGIKTEK